MYYLICPNERLLEDSGSQANFVQKPISAGALQESALFGYQAQKPKSATPLFFGWACTLFLFSQAQQRWVYFTMGNCCRRMQGKQVTGTMFIRKAVPDNFKLCNPDQNLLIKERALFQKLGSCPPPHHRGLKFTAPIFRICAKICRLPCSHTTIL